MKTILISTVMLLPCLAMLNESGNMWVNLFGLLYSGCLYFIAKYTHYGRRFAEKLYKETERINECLINKMK